MAEITLRHARAQDGARLAAIHIRSRRIAMPFLPHLHSDEETLQWMTSYVLPKLEVWAAETAGEIVGYMALEAEQVDHLYIAPEWQGRGAGKLLINQAKQLRSRRLQLYCFAMNAPARAFYESHGFVPIGFTDGERNEEQLADVLYEWTASR
jgi:ribosomal protein S18 acetylase RimI-like enzyme